MKLRLRRIDWRKGGEGIVHLATFLAVAPYALGEVADWIPPFWKATIFKVGIASGAFLKFWQMFVPPASVQQLQTTPTPVVDNVSLPLADAPDKPKDS